MIVFSYHFIIHFKLLNLYTKTPVSINRYIEYYLISWAFSKSVRFDAKNQIKITFVLLIKVFVDLTVELISNLSYSNL